MCERTRWPAGHFGLAVDKAMLDALLTARVEHGHAWRASPGDLQPARAYLAELHRLLEPGARALPAALHLRSHAGSLQLGIPRRSNAAALVLAFTCMRQGVPVQYATSPARLCDAACLFLLALSHCC